MCLQWQDVTSRVDGEQFQPKLVYDNYQKDCFYWNLYNVTYEEYMISIIDELVKYQDQVDTMDYDTGCGDICTVINNVTNKPTNT